MYARPGVLGYHDARISRRLALESCSSDRMLILWRIHAMHQTDEPTAKSRAQRSYPKFGVRLLLLDRVGYMILVDLSLLSLTV